MNHTAERYAWSRDDESKVFWMDLNFSSELFRAPSNVPPCGSYLYDGQEFFLDKKIYFRQ